MLSKPKIQLIQSLHQKKYRKQQGLFIAEGDKVVAELLQSSFRIHSIYATNSAFNENAMKSNSIIDRMYEVSDNDLKKISSLSTPNNVLAIAYIPEVTVEVEHLKNQLSLALDGINDPGNLGTIIRIADWFGVKNIICSTNTVDAFNTKTVQSAMGSLFRSNLFYTDLKDFITQYKSITSNKVFGTLLNGENIYQSKLSQNGLIVIGSESHGISNELLELIDEKIKIPSYSSILTAETKLINPTLKGSAAESLNAAIAAAIVLAEFRRLVK